MGCGRRHGRVVGQMAGFPNSGILPCSAVGALFARFAAYGFFSRPVGAEVLPLVLPLLYKHGIVS